MTDLAQGISGQYEVIQKIREGGMGAIYKVRHRHLEQLFIIKMMRSKLQTDEGLRQRFEKEARMACRLRHDNIAQLFDFALDDEGNAFMVLEFIDGFDLDEILTRFGPPPVDLAIETAVQSLSVLGYLHRLGIIHRDISPDNLMLTRDDLGNPQVKLIDLGVAKVIREENQQTEAGLFLGKLRYASPEHLESNPNQAIDHRTDLYSFGVVLYELLTGKHPIRGNSAQAMVAGHLTRAPRPFGETDRNGRLNSKLRAVVLQSLAKDPSKRFPTAEKFITELRLACPKRDLDLEVFNSWYAARDAERRDEEAQRTFSSTQHRIDRQFEAKGAEHSRASANPVRKTAKTTPRPTPVEELVGGKSEVQDARDRGAARQHEEIPTRPFHTLADHIQLAKAAFDDGDLDEALDHLHSAIQLSPQDDEILSLEEKIHAQKAADDHRDLEQGLQQIRRHFDAGEVSEADRLAHRLAAELGPSPELEQIQREIDAAKVPAPRSRPPADDSPKPEDASPPHCDGPDSPAAPDQKQLHRAHGEADPCSAPELTTEDGGDPPPDHAEGKDSSLPEADWKTEEAPSFDEGTVEPDDDEIALSLHMPDDSACFETSPDPILAAALEEARSMIVAARYAEAQDQIEALENNHESDTRIDDLAALLESCRARDEASIMSDFNEMLLHGYLEEAAAEINRLEAIQGKPDLVSQARDRLDRETAKRHSLSTIRELLDADRLEDAEEEIRKAAGVVDEPVWEKLRKELSFKQFHHRIGHRMAADDPTGAEEILRSIPAELHDRTEYLKLKTDVERAARDHRVRGLLDRAEELRESARFDEARAALHKAEKLDPRSDDVRESLEEIAAAELSHKLELAALGVSEHIDEKAFLRAEQVLEAARADLGPLEELAELAHDLERARQACIDETVDTVEELIRDRAFDDAKNRLRTTLSIIPGNDKLEALGERVQRRCDVHHLIGRSQEAADEGKLIRAHGILDERPDLEDDDEVAGFRAHLEELATKTVETAKAEILELVETDRMTEAETRLARLRDNVPKHPDFGTLGATIDRAKKRFALLQETRSLIDAGKINAADKLLLSNKGLATGTEFETLHLRITTMRETAFQALRLEVIEAIGCGRLDEAEAALVKARRISPEHAKLEDLTGRLHDARKRAEILSAAEKALADGQLRTAQALLESEGLAEGGDELEEIKTRLDISVESAVVEACDRVEAAVRDDELEAAKTEVASIRELAPTDDRITALDELITQATELAALLDRAEQCLQAGDAHRADEQLATIRDDAFARHHPRSIAVHADVKRALDIEQARRLIQESDLEAASRAVDRIAAGCDPDDADLDELKNELTDAVTGRQLDDLLEHAEILLDQGDLDEAEETLHRAERLAEDPRVEELFKRIRTLKKHHRAVLQDLSEVREILGDGRARAASARLDELRQSVSVSETLTAVGDTAALTDLEDDVESAVSHLEELLGEALARKSSGDFSEAYDCVRQAAEIDRECPRVESLFEEIGQCLRKLAAEQREKKRQGHAVEDRQEPGPAGAESDDDDDAANDADENPELEDPAAVDDELHEDSQSDREAAASEDRQEPPAEPVSFDEVDPAATLWMDEPPPEGWAGASHGETEPAPDESSTEQSDELEQSSSSDSPLSDPSAQPVPTEDPKPWETNPDIRIDTLPAEDPENLGLELDYEGAELKPAGSSQRGAELSPEGAARRETTPIPCELHPLNGPRLELPGLKFPLLWPQQIPPMVDRPWDLLGEDIDGPPFSASVEITPSTAIETAAVLIMSWFFHDNHVDLPSSTVATRSSCELRERGVIDLEIECRSNDDLSGDDGHRLRNSIRNELKGKIIRYQRTFRQMLTAAAREVGTWQLDDIELRGSSEPSEIVSFGIPGDPTEPGADEHVIPFAASAGEPLLRSFEPTEPDHGLLLVAFKAQGHLIAVDLPAAQDWLKKR